MTITTQNLCLHYLVSQEGLDDAVYDVLDSRPLYVIPVTTPVSLRPVSCVSPVSVVVLVHGLEPAHVVVAVADQVHVEQLRLGGRAPLLLSALRPRRRHTHSCAVNSKRYTVQGGAMSRIFTKYEEEICSHRQHLVICRQTCQAIIC